MSEYFLAHHGIKGQKWGVRRYQNEDGSLTPAGMKRYSKEYKKTIKNLRRDFYKRKTSLKIDAYNKVADKMNSGEIDRFNREQEKKYGKNFADRRGYEDDYNKIFNKYYFKELNKNVLNFYKKNKHYEKALKLSAKYNMENWDDFAKRNSQYLKGKHYIGLIQDK